MKVYKVTIYNADHFHEFGKLVPVGYAIVKHTIFSTKEVITNKTLTEFICGNDGKCVNTNGNEYKEYGYDLGVKPEDFKHKNLATEGELDYYLANFDKSELKKILSNMKVLQKSTNELKRVNKRVKQLHNSK